MSDDKKVVDFHVRRQAQLQKTDPVLILADKLTKLLAETAEDATPAEQLAAIELSARALMKTLQHAHGDVNLNAIIVDAEPLRLPSRFQQGRPNPDRLRRR